MTPDSPANLAWRTQSLEQGLREEREARRIADEKLDDLKADTKDVGNLANQMNEFRHEIREEVGSLRRALLIFSLSMVGTAVTFLAVIFAVVTTR